MEYHSGGSLPLLGRPRYCPGANANGGYLCETGHCCGETGCCTYYYELWWFWLLWTVLILFSCCCAYRHRRAKLRVQQQQRQREISLLAYHGASSYPSSMLDLSFLASLKLPSYEEVAAQPSTPPPPYSSVFTTPRYPQPPRASDPHLLTQHGPLLHQTLSDGPSSLSSDNSSSCSCDSCCPSSPCSSSLSAPVTYETDTSHATTPSEVTPFTLDVTMETITAAANCLEVNRTRFESERTAASVAIDMGEEVACRVQEPTATDSSAPNQTVTVALVTKAAPPHPLPSPGSEGAHSVETSSSLKLDLTPCPPSVSKCSSSAPPSPSLDTTLTSNQSPSKVNTPSRTHSPKTTSVPGSSTPTPCNPDPSTVTQTLKVLDLTRTFDTVPTGPTEAPPPDNERISALVAGSPTLQYQDPNPSLVPIQAPSNFPQSQAPEPTNHAQGSSPTTSNLTQASSPESATFIKDLSPVPINMAFALSPLPTKHTQALHPAPTNHIQATSTEPTDLPQDSNQMPANFTQLPDTISSDLIKDPNLAQDSSLTNISQDSNPDPSDLIKISVPVETHHSQATEAIAVNLAKVTNPVSIPDISFLEQAIPTLTQAPDHLPSTPAIVPNSHPEIPIDNKSYHSPPPNPAHSNLSLATDAAPTSLTLTQCQAPELSLGSGLALFITSPKSDLPQHQGPDAVLVSHQDPTTVPASSGPSLVLPLSSTSSVQAGLRTGSGSHSDVSLPTQEVSRSSCPAITIEAENSFAPPPSPPTILSPSSPSPQSLPSSPFLPPVFALSPTSPPAPTLLLDPLTALHQSNRGGSSSGHASSLSPSPRATQSPPKQTLFSPCVDIFEPDTSWEDGDEDQDQEDNDDDEDEDIGADESQYRHRRLTGDSGIEVCRCRMGDEDEEEEEEEEEKGKGMEDGRRGGGGERDKKGGGNTNLHDSVDCPARSQITTEEGSLCNPSPTTTSASEDKPVVVVETV